MGLHPRVAVVRKSLLAAIHLWLAFHRDVPELHAWGESPEAAVSNLADRLDLALLDATDPFHRAMIEPALAVVRTILVTSTSPELMPVGR